MKTIDEFITHYESIVKTKIEDAEEYTEVALQIFKSMAHCSYYQKFEKERQTAEWNRRAAECEKAAAECQQLVKLLKLAKEADEKEKQIREELDKLTVYYYITTKDNDTELVSRADVKSVLNLVYRGSRDAEVENDGQ